MCTTVTGINNVERVQKGRLAIEYREADASCVSVWSLSNLTSKLATYNTRLLLLLLFATKSIIDLFDCNNNTTMPFVALLLVLITFCASCAPVMPHRICCTKWLLILLHRKKTKGFLPIIVFASSVCLSVKPKKHWNNKASRKKNPPNGTELS